MKPSRFWELDTLRGLAIFLMVAFHIHFDLTYFLNFSQPTTHNSQLIWNIIGRTSAILFLILVGISLKLKYFNQVKAVLPKKHTSLRAFEIFLNKILNLNFNARQSRRNTNKPLKSSLTILTTTFHLPIAHDPELITRFLPFLTRGLYIFGWGLFITIITSFLPAGTIYFGILHLIGLSTILAFPFLKFKNLNLFISLAIFSTPKILNLLLTTQNLQLISSPWLLPLGLFPPPLMMLDYYPIFPWSGFIFLGIWLAHNLYPNNHRSFSLMNLSNLFLVKIFSLAGRHSLIIYLLHQPLFLAILWIIKTKL